MEIQAKLSFKHGRIMRVLDSAGISVKDFSEICGWGYQNLLAFVSFKRLPKCEDHERLLVSLQDIDPSITECEVFPPAYDQVKGVLHTRVSTKDIPVENLVFCNPDLFAIDDKTENRVALKIDASNALCEIQDILTGRNMQILEMYFGVGYKRPYTLEEIGKKLFITRERVSVLKDKSLRALERHSRMQKYKEIGALEVAEGQFTSCNTQRNATKKSVE